MTASTKKFRLVLVRHGQTDWNVNGRLMGRSDVELNEHGQAQAQAVADALKALGRPIDAIVSSPQVRARQTAYALSEAMGLDVGVEAGFDEVWLSEQWQGKTVEELRGDEHLEKTIRDPLHRCDRIELIADVQARAVEACERLHNVEPSRTVAVFSHGDPLRVIVAHYLGLDLALFRRLAVDNGSVSMIVFNPRGARVELLNWAPPTASIDTRRASS